MKSDIYIELLEKYLRKTISPDETRQLFEWINLPSSAGVFAEYAQRKWNEAPSELSSVTSDEIWERLKQETAPKPRFNLLGTLPKFYRVAASFLLPLCIAASAYFFFDGRKYHGLENSVIETVVARGQKASLTLPDGTRVWLNSATRLTYNANYNISERTVKLEGEAYFEVAPNPEKKFTVDCKGLSIEALGTAFNVKAFLDDDNVSTSLLEGKVKVYSDKNSVILAPGQNLTFNRTDNSFVQTEVEDTREIDFWRRNMLYFRSASLEEIAETLERMYGITVVFADEDLKQIQFSGSIRNNSINNVFHIISLTYPLTCEMEKDTVTISKQR